MKKNNKRVEKLWPIVEANPRFSFGPAGWLTINIGLALLTAVPFLLVVGIAATGFWGVGALREVALLHFPHNAWTVSLLANGITVFMLLFSLRVAYIMVGFLPFMVREARDLLDTIPSM